MNTTTKIEKTVFEYFDKHKETATSSRYYWYIGQLKIWVANEDWGLEIQGEYTIPKHLETPEFKKKIWDYYMDWCEKFYQWQPPVDVQQQQNEGE